MNCFPTLGALILATLSAGCSVGPDYVRPELPVASHYMGLKQAEPIKHTPSLSAADLSAWWTVFADAPLSRLVDMALAQNLDMAQAAARVLQARAGLDFATAALHPAGSLGAQTARSYQSVETPQGQLLNALTDFNRYGNAHEVNLGVSWEIDLFGGLQRAKQAARADYEATEAGAVAIRLAVAAQTADTYVQIRGLQARLQVARQQVDAQQQLRAMVALRLQKGLASELQLQQADGALARVQASIPLLEAALETAMNALDVMLGAAPGTHRAELGDAQPIPLAPDWALAATPGDLLRYRPDVIAAERRLAASSARIGAAMAEFYPKLSLTGLIGSATSLSSGNLLGSGAAQGSAVAGLRWRLFDFERINAQIDSAQAQEAESLAAYKQALLRATEDVENALVSLSRRREQAALLAQGADALQRARSNATTAYDKGVVSFIEVLLADQDLLVMRDAQVQADTEQARAMVATFKALGGGWSAPASPMAAR